MSRQKLQEPILKGKAYTKFLYAIKSQATKATYTFRLGQFLVYMNVRTPDDLLITKKTKTIEDKIIEYILHLRNRGLSRSSLEGVSATLQKFYSMNDILLNWSKIHAYLGDDEKTIEDDAYTRDQINKMLHFARPRIRVLVLLLASSGIRIGALADLKKKHLTYIEKYGIYQITIYPKANQRYITFCTPECVAAIKHYFDYRTRCGEILNDESPLIRKDFDAYEEYDNIEATTVKALKVSLDKLAKISDVKMQHVESNLNGVKKRTQRTKVMLAHGFRKFYCTNLGRARLQNSKIDALMGWKRGLLHVYDRSGTEELLEEYLKAIPLLTINDEDRLKVKVATLEDKDAEIQELKDQIAKVQQVAESNIRLYDKVVDDVYEKAKIEIHALRKQLENRKDK